MPEKQYECAFEIAGPTAMFTRPDTGAAPVSYPVPTYSAAKGMFEAIVRLRSAYISPTKVEICSPIKYQRYTTNYGGPLRKSDLLPTRSSYQLKATVLVNVCYRIYGVVRRFSNPPYEVNDLHACQEIFSRRLGRGQFFYVPCLGWKEFVPSYVGPFRETTRPDTAISLDIPSMLHSVFSQPVNGQVRPRFVQNAKIREGMLEYAE
jgi:CRISPR-associated protein Cas5d